MRRVHAISYNSVGNFGDRLGFHVLIDVLPAHAVVSWGTVKPMSAVPPDVDLLIIGIGNSLFGNLISDPLIEAAAGAKACIGIFGTQYRNLWPAARLNALLDHMDWWFARFADDVGIYGEGRSNVRHLGDWLINAFPMAIATDERTLRIGREAWKNLPLDRSIQEIQRYRRVYSARLHPLLCALTSAEEVAYQEQRESKVAGDSSVSGKFHSLFMDVFGRDFPEKEMWRVDRDAVMRYKALIRGNTDELKQCIAKLLD